MLLSKNKAKKQTTALKKTENEHAQIVAARCFVQQKKASKKRAKRIIKKRYNKAKEKTDSRIITIKRLSKQKNRKYAHRKSLKLRKWRRQQPA